MIKLLIFDFDGTLSAINSKSMDIINRLSQKYGFRNLDHSEFLNMRELELKAALKKLKIPFWKFPFIVADYKKMIHEYIDEEKLSHDSWINILKQLKSQIGKLGILTSNSVAYVKRFVKLHKIHDFDFIHSASIFGKHRSLQKIISQNQLKPNEVLYIGDEIRDIEACSRVGIPILTVTWGMNSKEALLKAEPDYSIDDPKEIFTIIDLLLGDACAAC